MQSKLKTLVLKLQKENIYIHFSKIRKYTKFGYQSIFKNEELKKYYYVLSLSKTLIQLNSLTQHLDKMIKLYRSLNVKIVLPILEIIQKNDMMYIVSDGFQNCLKDIVTRREGITEFQIGYFVADIAELMGYLRNRECFLEKIQTDQLFINHNLKISINFGLFFNALLSKPTIKKLAFRTQLKNFNICPDLCRNISTSYSQIDEINSWNIGTLAYQLFYNQKPFKQSNLALKNNANQKNIKNNQYYISLIKSKQYKVKFDERIIEPTESYKDFIRKLLATNQNERLKFSHLIIHSFFKQFPTVPHMLPKTIFSCPPSEKFKEEYIKKFEQCQTIRLQKQTQQKENSKRKQNSFSQKQIEGATETAQLPFSRNKKKFKTHMQIKSTQRSLSDNKIYIEQYVDISHVYGYGYQLNTGTISFVFNDQTQYYYPNGNLKMIKVRKSGKDFKEIVYYQDKLPEEDQIRKKVYILEAFSKTLKRYKSTVNQKLKSIKVKNYFKSKHASIFLFSNDNFQVFFNDKLNFIFNKNSTFIQNKNSDKYEKYEECYEDKEVRMRKQYCILMAEKLFFYGKSPQDPEEEVEKDSFVEGEMCASLAQSCEDSQIYDSPTNQFIVI